MRDEGVIKYNCEWRRTPPPEHATIAELNRWRSVFFARGGIGVYPDGIGYGNLSQRDASDSVSFWITGTQTGALQELGPEDFSRVVEFSLDANRVVCEGPAQASSESLTHAAAYVALPAARALIHIHHRPLWGRLLADPEASQSRADVPYGTPAMAREIERLAREGSLAERGVLAMAGHEEGVIALGVDLDEAGRRLLGLLDVL